MTCEFDITFGLFVVPYPYWSSCHVKATVALYFGRIRTRFRVYPFPSFPIVSLTFYHLICCLFKVTKYRQLS